MSQPIACNESTRVDHGRLYELLVRELTDFAVFLVDRGACIASWNPGVERLLGYTEEEWIGQPVNVIFTPEDRAGEIPARELAKAAREGRAPDIRWHLIKNGGRVYVEGTLVALRDSTGQLLGFAKIMRNVTERRRRELALDDARKYAENIVDTVREPLLVLDGALRVQSANRSFYRMFQLSKEETNGELLYNLGKEQWNIPRLRLLMEEILPEDKKVEDFEVEYQLPEIGRRVMLLNAGKLWREGNHTELILLAIEDVTERKQRLQDVKRSNEELAQFAHIVSHDLQAPLRGIGIASQLLRRHFEGQQLDSNSQEYLQTIASSVESMRVLIQTLLSYATVGQGDLAGRPVSLDTVLEAVLTSLGPLIAETRAEIVSRSLPTIKGDPVLLQQLLQNLLSNAIKYRKPEQTPYIFVQAQLRGDSWLVMVKDNGEGIDPRYYQQIFAPLKRLHGAEIEGTGLGLAVCKRIVERHGGRIWVESPGEGATFCFTLPRMDDR